MRRRKRPGNVSQGGKSPRKSEKLIGQGENEKESCGGRETKEFVREKYKGDIGMEPTLLLELRRVVVLGNWAYGPAIHIPGLLGSSTLLGFFLFLEREKN